MSDGLVGGLTCGCMNVATCKARGRGVRWVRRRSRRDWLGCTGRNVVLFTGGVGVTIDGPVRGEALVESAEAGQAGNRGGRCTRGYRIQNRWVNEGAQAGQLHTVALRGRNGGPMGRRGGGVVTIGLGIGRIRLRRARGSRKARQDMRGAGRLRRRVHGGQRRWRSVVGRR